MWHNQLISRNEEWARKFRAGQTYATIAAEYGVSRQCVQQTLMVVGITATDGGVHKQAKDNRALKLARLTERRDKRAMKYYGVPYETYKHLRDSGYVKRYRSQKGNAAARGIGWEISLSEWVSVWAESGKWSQRGRGQGYVMCRIGDSGPYKLGNVLIASARENVSNGPHKKSNLPIGVGKRANGKYFAQRTVNGVHKYLGTHETVASASRAYATAFEEGAEI